MTLILAELNILNHLKESNEQMLLEVEETIREANELKDKIEKELAIISSRILEQ